MRNGLRSNKGTRLVALFVSCDRCVAWAASLGSVRPTAQRPACSLLRPLLQRMAINCKMWHTYMAHTSLSKACSFERRV